VGTNGIRECKFLAGGKKHRTLYLNLKMVPLVFVRCGETGYVVRCGETGYVVRCGETGYVVRCGETGYG